MHRFGHKYDHSLLSVTWRWRIKKTQRFETADFNAMTNQSWSEFDNDLRIRLEEFAQPRVHQHETRVDKHGHNGHSQEMTTQNSLTHAQELGNLQQQLATCIKQTIQSCGVKEEKETKEWESNVGRN